MARHINFYDGYKVGDDNGTEEVGDDNGDDDFSLMSKNNKSLFKHRRSKPTIHSSIYKNTHHHLSYLI